MWCVQTISRATHTAGERVPETSIWYAHSSHKFVSYQQYGSLRFFFIISHFYFSIENKESRELQQKTVFQLESDKFRLEEELQQTKDQLQQTKEDNVRLNERLTQIKQPTPSTIKATSNGVDDADTTTSSRNKSLNSKIFIGIKIKYFNHYVLHWAFPKKN